MPGAHVPTLDQVFRAVPRARVVVEAKIDPYEPRDTYAPAVVARHIVDTVRAARALRADDGAVLRLARAARGRPPGAAAAAAGARQRRDAVPGQPLARRRARALAPVPLRPGQRRPARGLRRRRRSLRKASPTLVAAAHGRRIDVVAYTVDNPQRMAALIARGVDGIITDYPDRLRAAVRDADLR